MHSTLSLDARRHAMLKAMGVEPWWMPAPPQAPPVPQPQTHTPPPLRQEQPARSMAVPAPAAEPLDAKAGLPSSVPPAVAQPTKPRAMAPPAPAPALDVARQALSGAWFCQPPLPVFGAADASPPEGARWLFITDDFAEAGVDAPQVQQLFHNMLRAMGLFEHAGVWLGQMQRVAVDAAASPTAVTLEQVAQTLRPQVVVLMGRVAAQTLLQNRQPLGVLRQTPHQVCGMPVLATYSPGYLLHAPHAKAGAWADLRQALRLAQALHALP